MCNFRVGQKVLCINDQWNEYHANIARRLGVTLPVLGGIYTIRAIEIRPQRGDLYFVEIVNPIIEYDIGRAEQGFHVARFRPVVERKTDISVFRAMLNPSKQPVEA
jgi:hypothetical protein